MKDFARLLVLAAGLLVLLLAGCEQKKDEGVRTTIYDKAKLAEGQGEKAPVLLPVQQQEYLDSVKNRLADLDNRIGKLKDKVAALPEAARSKFTGQMEELRKERELAKEKFSQLQEAGTDGWQQAKEAMDGAISKLEENVNQLTIQMEKT